MLQKSARNCTSNCLNLKMNAEYLRKSQCYINFNISMQKMLNTFYEEDSKAAEAYLVRKFSLALQIKQGLATYFQILFIYDFCHRITHSLGVSFICYLSIFQNHRKKDNKLCLNCLFESYRQIRLAFSFFFSKQNLIFIEV